jgi:Carbohydrate-selective porin, OprB family
MVEVVIGKQGMDDRILVVQATSMRCHDAPLIEDRFGIGFYYTNFSNDVPEIILSGDEIGLEIFYNIAATHWLYVTLDIQVIEPAGKRATTAFLTGLRLQMHF